jgi:branched-chain amino acid transport system ATP-binding protein
MSQGPLLEARCVTKRFGGLVAVDAVDLTLAEGELRCLIGPNGAGKSTFFKMLTGQFHPTDGTIKFRGNPIMAAMPHEIARRGIGIKTQTPSVFNGLTVHENLWLAARRLNPSRRANEIVAEVLDLIGFAGRAGRFVGELSHGQRQWVEIGTVLAAEPELILLDEPAAGMTHDEVVRTAEIIREVNRHKALIVVEHDMQFIKMIAQTVTVFSRGQVLVEGPAEAVMCDQRVRDVYLGKKAVA